MDFKKELPPPPFAFELAKDVAMFANANGGVILVGAQEDMANARLGKYFPMTEPAARAARDEYEKAIAARCTPKPLYDAVILEQDTGFVVAVNVWPFPGQFVAVRTSADAVDGYKGPAFVFSVRLGTNCQYLTPEQTAMFTVPELRRVLILLNAIPAGAKVIVTGCNLNESSFEMGEVHRPDRRNAA